ncbi:biotin/lipoyl-binding protein [Devosia algicola]|uniref:Biotin/lipoyl-binding protein n=1 Tax=Devosia algicola TaxID=3026418 RepID=A0ABY7YNK6_9HYPH|nr:biotin/lipoyl-binding protein [Devosia algicola]WDR02824.1 biotin/lipoyl-binding protein [Devosia algicola]
MAVWLSTGTLVIGGNGPGKGEKPLIAVIEGQNDGPIAKSLDGAGLLAEAPHSDEATDPALTIAERVASTSTGESVPLQSVRTVTYMVKPMALQVPLRGRTQAKSTVTAVAQTAAIVDTVHVTKGQRVAVGDKLCTLDQGTRVAAVEQAKAGLEQAKASQVQAQARFRHQCGVAQKGAGCFQ